MALREWLAQNYLYIFLILGALLCLWIYSKQDIYTRTKIKKICNKKNLLIVGFVVGWLLWSHYGGSEVVKNSSRWMPVVFLMYLLSTQFFEALRYHSQQFISPNFHGSFARPPFEINGYYIFAIDSFNASGLAWDYAKRIVVVRKETCSLFLHGALSLSKLDLVDKDDLEKPIRVFIENNKFFKTGQENIYFGFFDDIEQVNWKFKQLKKLAELNKDPENIYNMLKKVLKVENPDIKTLMDAYQGQCKVSNTVAKQFGTATKVIEDGGEHNKVMREIYTEKPKPKEIPEGSEEY